MKSMENADGGYGDESRTSPEKYLLLDEKEKDIEIQKAVLRINKRIQEILYLIDADKH